MSKRSIWASTKSLLVVFDYINELQLRDFRKALDQMLNESPVGRLVIVVNVPKEVDKTTLPPHFLIYYNSPNDYSFLGKLKDIQLEQELQKHYDLLMYFGKPQDKLFRELKKVQFLRKVIVNQTDDFFDLQLMAEEQSPEHMLLFVTQTLEKISPYD